MVATDEPQYFKPWNRLYMIKNNVYCQYTMSFNAENICLDHVFFKYIYKKYKVDSQNVNLTTLIILK